ncbi:TerC family protein [Bacillus tianshenii]|nr:TerC family protein [Bacillus tianshenii]
MDAAMLDFLGKLFSIVIIDLVLAGDNAILIGLAARNLPAHQQKKVIIWGAAGAILIRSVATIGVVWLLKIPGLLLIGGLVLILIAYRLLIEDQEEEKTIQSKANLWGAIKTIIIADAAMGLDNVIAVAGAAHGNFTLVILGLLISIPFVVWGSTLILKLINRFPAIIYIGSGVLAFTAGKMLFEDPYLTGGAHDAVNPLLKWSVTLIIVSGVLGFGYLKKKQKRSERELVTKEKQAVNN